MTAFVAVELETLHRSDGEDCGVWQVLTLVIYRYEERRRSQSGLGIHSKTAVSLSWTSETKSSTIIGLQLTILRGPETDRHAGRKGEKIEATELIHPCMYLITLKVDSRGPYNPAGFNDFRAVGSEGSKTITIPCTESMADKHHWNFLISL